MSPTTRYRIEAVVGAVTLVLAILTAALPDWIEKIFDASPDGGDGEMEVWIVVVFALATVVMWTLAFFGWRRAASE
jgi:hypothetical protein